jgi:hypothetical protein
MKRIIIPQTVLAAAAAFGLVASASAQPLVFTFDSSAQNFQNFSWSSTGPAGWSGGAAIQSPAINGGWTLGGSYNYYHEFDWASGEQPIMQTLAASGLGHLSFDLILDGTSFPNDTGGVWYSIEIAGNSAGANGWTQIEKLTGDAWHNQGDTTLYSYHCDYTFAQLGWADPEDATGWFQLYFGSNSDSAHPVNFYIDDVTCYAVPEPSTLVLAGLGVAGLLIFRRRK